MVCLRLPSGETLCSEPFPVRRGVIQGDIFSPQCFTLGLDRIFRLHDIAGQGIGGPSSQGQIMPKYMEPCFFYIYTILWSFLHDFKLLNPNPLSARRKSLSNLVQTQQTKMTAKNEKPFEYPSLRTNPTHIGRYLVGINYNK